MRKPINAYAAPGKGKPALKKKAAAPSKRPGAQLSPQGKRSAASRPSMRVAAASGSRAQAPAPSARPSAPRPSKPAMKRLVSVAAAPKPQASGPRFAALSSLLSKIPKPAASRGVVFGVLGAVALIALLAIVIINSGIFAATDVRISGSEHVSRESAEQLIDLPEGTTLLNVSEDHIVDNLMQNPWVAGVDIERQFPHTLIITPRERAVSALVYIAADDIAWAIGDDGCWIAPISLAVTVDAEGNVTESGIISDDAPPATQPADAGEPAQQGGDASQAADAGQQNGADPGARQLSGLEAAQQMAHDMGAVLFIDVSTSVSPSSGRAVDSDVVLAGLKYAAGFSEDFLSQVKFLSIPSEEAIAANLVSGVEVALGAPDDISKKERVVTKLLEQEQGVTYVDVRTPDAYTFRSVPE
ncbi:MAG: FtsQ-type POTRA domain-containing protein [Collinsella sp.]|nr:FtsQ-type POTRA domain-containing protein [Collinsella sp.]